MLETSQSFGIKEDALADEALLYVVTSLNLGLGLYGSSEGEGKGLKLDACKEFIRAWPGGTGSFKLGANYGESIFLHLVRLGDSHVGCTPRLLIPFDRWGFRLTRSQAQ